VRRATAELDAAVASLGATAGTLAHNKETLLARIDALRRDIQTRRQSMFLAWLVPAGSSQLAAEFYAAFPRRHSAADCD
jgi:hypothetical protein